MTNKKEIKKERFVTSIYGDDFCTVLEQINEGISLIEVFDLTPEDFSETANQHLSKGNIFKSATLKFESVDFYYDTVKVHVYIEAIFEESDESYQKRIEKEQKNKEKKLARKPKIDQKELALYKKLQKKYGKIVN